MRDFRICFMGDSYMNGTSDPEMLGWVGRLCQARYDPAHRFTRYELGVRGDTTDGVRARWKSECMARLPEGTDNRVVVQFGLNDLAEVVGSGLRVPFDQSVANAREIVKGVSALYPTLWISLPPVNVACSPMTPSPGFVINFVQDRAIKLNDAYRSIAGELGIDYLDILTPLLASPEYMDGLTKSDRMHCDSHGYQAIADLVDAWEPWDAWFKQS